MVPRNAQYYYSDCRMFIIKGGRDFDPTVEKNIEYIAGTKDFHKRDVYLEVKDLKRGYYYLFCEVDWNDESSFAQQSYTASCYGESKITFENKTKDFKREDIVRATCTAMLRDGKVQSMTQGLPGNEAPGIQITEFKTEFSYAMYQIQNNEPELTYVETADFLKFDKVELMLPESGSSYKVQVDSGQSKQIVLKFGCNGFSVSKSYSYILVKNDNSLHKDCLNKGQRLSLIHI